MSEPVKIMLVEDSPEYRKVIGMAFKRDEGIELIHTTGTAERALSILEHARRQEFPDLILLDLNLPGMNGLAAVASLRAVAASVKILVLTQSDREEDVLQAIKAGASGYLLKSSGIQQIRDGIKTLMDGGSPVDSKIAQYILRLVYNNSHAEVQKNPMSNRELEVLVLMADGLVKKQIATLLDISPYTVQAHCRNIYEKLCVPNATAAVSQAYRLGLIPVKKQ